MRKLILVKKGIKQEKYINRIMIEVHAAVLLILFLD